MITFGDFEKEIVRRMIELDSESPFPESSWLLCNIPRAGSGLPIYEADWFVSLGSGVDDTSAQRRGDQGQSSANGTSS